MNESKYLSLYEVLPRCQYILANSLERAFSDIENYPLYEALAEHSREYFEAMTDDELKGYGWDGELDRDEFIADQQYPDIYQTFIVDERTHDVLKDFGEVTYYNETADAYFWGVTHFGTAWSHVMGEQYPVKNCDAYLRSY